MASASQKHPEQPQNTLATLLHAVCIVALFAITGVALAQDVGSPAAFFPPQPTPGDQIRARIEVGSVCSPFDPSTVISGSTVRTTLRMGNCFPGPPPFPVQYDVLFGPLPAGTYTYELYFIYDTTPQLQSRQQLAITASTSVVPVLSSRALLLLTIALATVAAVTLRSS